MRYATFWRRLGASFLDAVCVLPPLFLCGLLKVESKTAAFILVLPTASAFIAYNTYGHGRFGKTIGKLCMGIRLVSVSGEPVTWRQAWLRSAVDIVLSALWAIATFVALSRVTDVEYYDVGWMKQSKNVYSHQPPWLTWTDTAGSIWIASELVVMLFNRQRRALHDFIAGTIVVQNDPSLTQR